MVRWCQLSQVHVISLAGASAPASPVYVVGRGAWLDGAIQEFCSWGMRQISKVGTASGDATQSADHAGLLRYCNTCLILLRSPEFTTLSL